MQLDVTQLSEKDFANSKSDAVIAMRLLPTCDTEECAKKYYWMLDNNVVLQGTLYPAAFVLLPEIMQSTVTANVIARKYLLDLVLEIVSGGANMAKSGRYTANPSSLLGEWQSEVISKLRNSGELSSYEDSVLDDIEECIHIIKANT